MNKVIKFLKNSLPVLKSSNMWVKLGHFAASSCKTLCVINSIGSSMYLSDGPNRIDMSAKSDSSEPKKILELHLGHKFYISIFFKKVAGIIKTTESGSANE